MTVPEVNSQPKQNGQSLSQILDPKNGAESVDMDMDIAPSGEEEEPEVETVASEGYCVECEGKWY